MYVQVHVTYTLLSCHKICRFFFGLFERAFRVAVGSDDTISQLFLNTFGAFRNVIEGAYGA